MLFLIFQIGQDRYALEGRRVIEVLPLVKLKRVPKAPTGVAGILNFRGRLVPVLDLSEMASNIPAVSRLSTRLLVIDFSPQEGEGKMLGLIAENVTEMLRCHDEDFETAGVKPDGAPFLGPILRDERGIVQRIEIEKLISQEVRDVLFKNEVKTA